MSVSVCVWRGVSYGDFSSWLVVFVVCLSVCFLEKDKGHGLEWVDLGRTGQVKKCPENILQGKTS